MLTATSPEILAMIEAYQENCNLAHSRGRSGYRIVVVERRKYLAIDEVPTFDGEDCPSQSGRFLIDRATSVVYSIKGYGQRGWRVGTVEGLTAQYLAGSATFNRDAGGHVATRHSRVASWGGHPSQLAPIIPLRGGAA